MNSVYIKVDKHQDNHIYISPGGLPYTCIYVSIYIYIICMYACYIFRCVFTSLFYS